MNAAASADRAQALTVVCPEARCAAFPGELCINLGTGAPLERQAAHMARLKAAGVEHPRINPDDLRRVD